MAEITVFRYRPICSHPGCKEPALYKVCAEWSAGTSHELKNYGLACENHRRSQMERAVRQREILRVAEGESVGPVTLIVLEAARLDLEPPTKLPGTTQGPMVDNP